MICERKCPVHGYGLSICILFLVHQTFLVLSNQTERFNSQQGSGHSSLINLQPASSIVMYSDLSSWYVTPRFFSIFSQTILRPQSPDQLCCEACQRTIERRHRRFKQRMRSAQIAALFFFTWLNKRIGHPLFSFVHYWSRYSLP